MSLLGQLAQQQALACDAGAFVALIVLAVAAALWVFKDHAIGTQRSPNAPILPGGKPVIGHLMLLIRNQYTRMYDWQLDSSKQMGWRTFSWSLPFTPTFYSVTDPACLEYVLKTELHNFVKGSVHRGNCYPLLGKGIFTSDNEEWYWQRKLASHIFNVQSFKSYIDVVFADELNILMSNISAAAQSGEVIDIHDLMYRFTLDSFGRIGFGVQLGCLSCQEQVPFAEAFDKMQMVITERFTTPGWQVLEHLNGSRSKFNNWSKVIQVFAAKIIRQRRKQLAAATTVHTNDADAANPSAVGHDYGKAGDPGHDLLSLFMASTGPDGAPLTDQQLVDTVLNFILAGRDTTAQALSWTLYQLLHHPECELKVLAELQEVLGPHQCSTTVHPTYDQLRQLKYTKACFLEALRLNPSVPNMVKYAVKTNTLPDGTIIPKGGQVLYSPYVTNRMPSFWGEDAESFRPERWLEMDSMPSAYSYNTFNAGPRLCLGQRLAELEGVYVLAGLLSRFSFKLAVPGQKVTYAHSLSMPMAGGLFVVALDRQTQL